jgi:hypothetical protein
VIASWSVINRTLHSTLKANKTVSRSGVDFDLIRPAEHALQIEDNCTNVGNTARSPTKVGVLHFGRKLRFQFLSGKKSLAVAPTTLGCAGVQW